MTVKLWEAPTQNATQTTLDGTLTASATTITLTSTSNMVAPGVVVIDRTDGTNDTPTKREYVTFTGISGNDLTGCTRGVAGSSAQIHSSGAKVEMTITVTHWGDLVDFLEVEHDASGQHVIDTATVNYTETHRLAVTSVASIAEAWIDSFNLVQGFVSTITITGLIHASGASIVGFGGGIGGLAPFTYLGALAADTNVSPLLIVEDAATLKSISAVLKSPVSSASLVLDVNLNSSSLFDSGTNVSILGGGTYVSTASLNTFAVSPGDLVTLDIDNAGGSDLTVLLET